MKFKYLSSPKIRKVLEKSVLLLFLLIFIIGLQGYVNFTIIRDNNLTINSIERTLENLKKELNNVKSDDESIKDTSLIKYNLWLSNCAGVSSEFIYNKTSGLKILSEKPQTELDQISKDFKIQIGNKDYSNLVKFIILDKRKNTFLTNDTSNIDFIKTNIPLFLKGGGDLFNYVSGKGKWYHISYDTQSNPYSLTTNPKIGIETTDPNNFVEAYWFPNDYKYPKEDDPILAGLIKDISKHYEDYISNETKELSRFENMATENKAALIIDIVLILIILLCLYFIGLQKIKNSFSGLKILTNFMEGKSTLFKSIFFILYSVFVVIVSLYILGNYRYKSFDAYYLFSIVVLTFYFLYILPKFIRFTRYIDEIIKGSDKITSGDIDFIIKEKGENSLLKLAKNINSINKGFKISIEEQIKNERLKSELVTNVSHDLKTPLTSIINYTDILLREDISEEERLKFLQVLNTKSLRLKKLIEDLFDISKINSGKVELNRAQVDVVELVDQSIAEYSDTEIYLDKNLNFIIAPFAPIIEMNLDGNKMSRVFENLINNSLKYSLKDTRVYVNIEEIERGIKISFKNISFEPLNFNKEEIFERFTRGDWSRNSEVDGSGLGLSIAKSIIELHGGKMYIDFDGDLFKAIIELYYCNVLK